MWLCQSILFQHQLQKENGDHPFRLSGTAYITSSLLYNKVTGTNASALLRNFTYNQSIKRTIIFFRRRDRYEKMEKILIKILPKSSGRYPSLTSLFNYSIEMPLTLTARGIISSAALQPIPLFLPDSFSIRASCLSVQQPAQNSGLLLQHASASLPEQSPSSVLCGSWIPDPS